MLAKQISLVLLASLAVSGCMLHELPPALADFSAKTFGTLVVPKRASLLEGRYVCYNQCGLHTKPDTRAYYSFSSKGTLEYTFTDTDGNTATVIRPYRKTGHYVEMLAAVTDDGLQKFGLESLGCVVSDQSMDPSLYCGFGRMGVLMQTGPISLRINDQNRAAVIRANATIDWQKSFKVDILAGTSPGLYTVRAPEEQNRMIEATRQLSTILYVAEDGGAYSCTLCKSDLTVFHPI